MSRSEAARLVAWASEMRAVHQRLRDALAVARESAGTDDATPAADLLVFCGGFCTALSGHHGAEDAVLFPEIESRHPELTGVLAKLRQDHSMIEHLVGALDAATARGDRSVVIEQHLDGIGAVMESHFGYEERQLLVVLETLDLDADIASVFGPL